MVWLAWYGSETVPPTDTSVLKKHVLLFLCLQKNMFSCSYVFKKTCSLVLMSSKKHVLLSSCLQKKHVILFSCLQKNMFSCPHVFKKNMLSCSHVFKKTCYLVLMSSCLKNKNMFSCPHVFKKKHVLLSNRWLAWYGSETVPPTILVI